LDEGLGVLGWIGFGLVGGGLGSAVWIAVAYVARVEVGWIAWGTGAVVGVGVRIGAGKAEGTAPGLVALAVAMFSLLGAKFIVAGLLMQNEMAEKLDPNNEEVMIAHVSHQVVSDKLVAGNDVDFTKFDEDAGAYSEERFPPEIWAEAKARWQGMSPDEQEAEREAVRLQNALVNQGGLLVGFLATLVAFFFSFGWMDILWFGLAAMSAYKIGGGFEDDD
jgi:hypothetical protein